MELLEPLLKTGLPLIGHVLKPLAKRVLIPLGAATDAAIHKKLFGSGVTTLITSNEEMNDIMKIVRSIDESGSSGNLGATLLLGNLLTNTGTITAA